MNFYSALSGLQLKNACLQVSGPVTGEMNVAVCSYLLDARPFSGFRAKKKSGGGDNRGYFLNICGSEHHAL